MATDPVTASASAPPVLAQLQAEQSKPDEQAKKAEQARQEEKAERARQAEQARQDEQRTRPVVNTQGQTTGKVVNITA